MTTRLVLYIVSLIGLCTTLVSLVVIQAGHPLAGAVVMSVGTSIIAAAIVSIVTERLLAPHDEIAGLRHVWGLIAVFDRRDKITDRCKEELRDSAQIDISAATGRTFLSMHGDHIAQRVRDGKATVRLLLPNPASMSSADTAHLLGLEEGDVLRTVTAFEEWVKTIRSGYPTAPISLHYASERIPSSYLRIDEVIFWGPYLKGLPSQNTFTFELSLNSNIGQLLARNFDFMIRSYGVQYSDVRIIEFMGMPASGKSTVVGKLKAAVAGLHCISNEDVQSHEGDTPLSFNQKIARNLNAAQDSLAMQRSVIFDRGVNDFRFWLKVHRLLRKLSEAQVHSLLSELHVPPPGIRYLTFAFLQPPDLTLRRRSKPERAVDQMWALHRQTLDTLSAETNVT